MEKKLRRSLWRSSSSTPSAWFLFTLAAQKLWNAGVRAAEFFRQRCLAKLRSHAEATGDGRSDSSQGEVAEKSCFSNCGETRWFGTSRSMSSSTSISSTRRPTNNRGWSTSRGCASGSATSSTSRSTGIKLNECTAHTGDTECHGR